MLQQQLELESTYSKSGKDELLHQEIDVDKRFFSCIECIKNAGIPSKGAEAAQALYLEILSDRNEMHIQSIGTRIGTRLGKEGLEAIELGVKILEACADVDIYDVRLYPKSIIIHPRIRVSDETQKKIDSYRYLPPMLCQPKDWTNNTDGGYLSIRHHAILKTKNHHNKPLNLEVLNKLQSVEMVLDGDILFNYIDTQELEHDVHMYAKFLDLPFRYMWQYDGRGRFYTAGYEINFQSTEFKKALHSLKEKVLITV